MQIGWSCPGLDTPWRGPHRFIPAAARLMVRVRPVSSHVEGHAPGAQSMMSSNLQLWPQPGVARERNGAAPATPSLFTTPGSCTC